MHFSPVLSLLALTVIVFIQPGCGSDDTEQSPRDMATFGQKDTGGLDMTAMPAPSDGGGPKDLASNEDFRPAQPDAHSMTDQSIDSDLSSPLDMGQSEERTHFVTTWKTDIMDPKDATLRIDTGEGDFLYDVDWEGDGVFEQAGLTASVAHAYSSPGTYTVRIRGIFPHFLAAFGPADTLETRRAKRAQANKLQSVDQWGTIKWGSMKESFSYASNVKILAIDAPDLSVVKSMEMMFSQADTMNQNINHWDTSNVSIMSGLFSGARSFNQPLEGWDTSNVTFMRFMFSQAREFNQPLSSWNTSGLRATTGMFSGARSFNQPLEAWDTSMVADMSLMFRDAKAFDQPLGTWKLRTGVLMNTMLNDSGLSTKNYDLTLRAWSMQQPPALNVKLEAQGLTYCDAEAARKQLIEREKWSIEGGQEIVSLSARRQKFLGLWGMFGEQDDGGKRCMQAPKTSDMKC